MKRFRKILLTTDFSRLSTEAFRYAGSLAKTFNAGIVILHVIGEGGISPFPYVDASSETVMKDAEESATKELRKLAKNQLRGFEGVELRVARGVPNAEILRTAAEEHVDCIVIATHGRTGLARALIGSVAESVVRHSPIPVLTITPKAIRRALAGTEALEPHTPQQ